MFIEVLTSTKFIRYINVFIAITNLDYTTSTKFICYINVFIVITNLLHFALGDYIVYLLKCRKGIQIKASLVLMLCCYNAHDENDVSVFQYNGMYIPLLSYPNDYVGLEKDLYINGEYISRKCIGIHRGNIKIIIALIIYLSLFLWYIVSKWETCQDILICCFLFVGIVIYILFYPYLYKWYLKRIRKKTGM